MKQPMVALARLWKNQGNFSVWISLPARVSTDCALQDHARRPVFTILSTHPTSCTKAISRKLTLLRRWHYAS